MVLADTNILSTFAKINQLPLLLRLFGNARIGVVPAVYEECEEGVSKGYTVLRDVVSLIKQGEVKLVLPTTKEVFEKATLPGSFDTGERETMVVANSRGYSILTNETQVKNWCKRTGVGYFDLPGILRALWRTNLLNKEEVRTLMVQIEGRDRIVFKHKEQVFED